MGILSSKRYEEILDKALSKNYKTFIETGTYNGRSIIPLAKEFYNVNFYTIEIVKELYLFAKNKAEDEGLKNINFYHGDSRDLLKKILNSIDSEHVIIFLDAHSSSYEGYSAETIDLDNNENFFIRILNKILNKKKTVTTDIKKNKLSNIEVPLLEELNLISTIKKNFLIVIDDHNLFGEKFNFADWKDINEKAIDDIFKDRLINSFTMPKQGLSSPQYIIEIKI
tara:strand:- start:4947 stop:5621 length:675 start_codon:yes stop_codon:yes gene_type:complete